MKLKRLIVKKLFGVYDYDLSFNCNECITILHGPNGCGKSTILGLIKALKNITEPEASDYITNVLDEFVFSEVEYILDNGYCLKFVKSEGFEDKGSVFNTPVKYFAEKVEKSQENNDRLNHLFDRYGLGISFESKDILITLPITAYWKASEHENYYKYTFSFSMSISIGNSDLLEKTCVELDKMNYFEDNVTCFDDDEFISTLSWEMEPCSIIDINPKESTNDINLLSDAINKQVENIKVKNREKISEAYKNFPINVLNKALNKKEMLYHDRISMYNALQLIENEYIELKKFGILKECKLDFIDKLRDEKFKLPVNINCVVNQYIEDAQTELKSYQGLKTKIDFFLELINECFVLTGKRIDVKHGKGFSVILNKTGKEIDLKDLSRGEQQLIYNLYKIIFESLTNDIVLVDEPEISMHIAWQTEYVDALLKICVPLNIQVIIATHAPHIVNNHFGLLTKLSAENDCDEE